MFFSRLCAGTVETLFAVPWIDDERALLLSGVNYSDDTFHARAVFARIPAFDVDYGGTAIPISETTLPFLDAGFHLDVDSYTFSFSLQSVYIPEMHADVASRISPQTVSLLSTPIVGGMVSVYRGDACLSIAGGNGGGVLDIEGTDFGEYSVLYFWSSVSWRTCGAYYAFVRGDLSAAAWLNLTEANRFSFSGEGISRIDAFGAWATVGINGKPLSFDMFLSCAILANGGTNLIGETRTVVNGEAKTGSAGYELERGPAVLLLCRPTVRCAISRTSSISVSRFIPFLWGWDVSYGPYGLNGDDIGVEEHTGNPDLRGIDLRTLLLSGIMIGFSVAF